jgi:hypothetical protein
MSRCRRFRYWAGSNVRRISSLIDAGVSGIDNACARRPATMGLWQTGYADVQAFQVLGAF